MDQGVVGAGGNLEQNRRRAAKGSRIGKKGRRYLDGA
jgi:hypothetical protein